MEEWQAAEFKFTVHYLHRRIVPATTHYNDGELSGTADDGCDDVDGFGSKLRALRAGKMVVW